MNREIDFGEVLYSRLPQIYKKLDGENKDLQKILKVFGGALNNIFKDISNYKDLRDFDKCPDKYLPYLCEMLGIIYEPTIPHEYQRRFLRNHAILRNNKGTLTAIQYLTKELAGTEAEVEIIDGKVEIYIIKADKGYENDNIKDVVEKRKIENYIKYYIPVLLKLYVYLYYGAKSDNITMQYRGYDFKVPFKICNRFKTDGIKGALIINEREIHINTYWNYLNFPICNMFNTATIVTIDIGEDEEVEVQDYKLGVPNLFKRAGDFEAGEGEI